MNNGIDQLLGKQIGEGIDKIPLTVFRQIGDESCVQRGIIQSRFQIDEHPILSDIAPHMSGGRQNQRSRYTEMGEKHLAHLRINHLAARRNAQRYIFQGKAGKRSGILLRDHGDQGRDGLGHGHTNGAGKAVTVPAGSGSGIGCAAGGYDHGIRRVLTGSGSDAVYAVFIVQKGSDLLLHNVHSQPLHHPLHGTRDVRRFIGNGEYPAASLGFQRHAVVLKEGHNVRGSIAEDGAGEELAVFGHVVQHLCRGAVVGHVAPALAGDPELSSQNGVGLIYCYGECGRFLCRGNGSGHTGGTAADDDQVRRVIHPNAYVPQLRCSYRIR